MTGTDNSDWHQRWRPRTKFAIRAFIYLILCILTIVLFWYWEKGGFSEENDMLFDILYVYISLGLGGAVMVSLRVDNSPVLELVEWD